MREHKTNKTKKNKRTELNKIQTNLEHKIVSFEGYMLGLLSTSMSSDVPNDAEFGL